MSLDYIAKPDAEPLPRRVRNERPEQIQVGPATAAEPIAHGMLEESIGQMKARAALRDAGSGERSMARTIGIFNAWTGNSLTEEDGWRFMVALKQAREVQGHFNRDDYVDLAAYAALLGECENGNPNRSPKG